jgi:regulator of protease activity HflC (stomatin/prohibitin superfamily)
VVVHRFPAALQAVEFAVTTSETARSSPLVYSTGRIEIDTSDGSKMHADVMVTYRLADAYKVMKELGPGSLYETNAVVPMAQAVLKENLGKLSAEDFYNQGLRHKATQAAQAAMAPRLMERGIAVENVLIRQYYYASDYQKQIEHRKVQDQLVFTQTSRAEAAREDARKRKISAEGEAAVEVEKRRGDAEVTKIRAEADLYARKKRAEGDLLVTLTMAKGAELENAAYEGLGSQNMVAERMAEVLQGLDLVVLSDSKTGGFNPLDLDGLLKMFGAAGAP